MDVIQRFKQFEQWFKTKGGQRLEQELSECLEQIPQIMRGDSLLQIANCGDNTWLKQMRYQDHWLLSPNLGVSTDLVSFPEALPFAKESLDCIFAPFLFDVMQSDPLILVSELDRVLKSMGYMVILGMNPTGLWRVNRFFSMRKEQWYQQPTDFSYWKIKALFKNLGYEQIHAQFFYYIPPIQSKTWINYFDIINRISRFIAFYPPAFFLLTLQKKQASLIAPVFIKSGSY
jgi:hypothetical protein